GRALDLVKRICPSDTRLHGLMLAIKHLVGDDLAAAGRALDDVRDDSDSRWWQLYAQLNQQRGDEDVARHAWGRAGELMPHPQIIRRSIKAALATKAYASAAGSLRKLLQTEPENAQDLNALASVLLQMGDLSEAQQYLARLVELSPEHVEYRLR